MQISSPFVQASPRSSDATNLSPFSESRDAPDRRDIANAESLSSIDRSATDPLEENDDRADELSFEQLLNDTPPEPAVDFQQPEETLVDDQLSIELPSQFNNVLPPSDKVVDGKIGEAARSNRQQRGIGQPPLLPETAPTESATTPTDIDLSSLESAQEQVEYFEIEPSSVFDFSDTGSFEQPSVTPAPTPPLDLPTLPTGPASHQEVTQTVAETIVEQAQLTEVGESKQLTLQLHPSELGQVTLQVDWEVDSLKVRIVASELAANEILNQNKSELIAALAEEGIDFDSLDVSYGNAQSEPEDNDNNNSRSQQLAPDLFDPPADPKNTAATSPNGSSNLDITA